MLDKIPQWTQLGLVLSCFRKLLMIDSISLMAVGLVTWSISFCVSFGRWSLKELVHFIQDEMAGWHRLSELEFEQTLGGSQGQGRLAWGYKELDVTERLKNNKPLALSLNQPFPTFFGTRDQFHGRRQFFHGVGEGKIQAHYIHGTLYFYSYISSTSNQQALDPRGWASLI